MIGKITVIILIFSITLGIEVPNMIKDKQWKEMIIASVLVAIAFIITLLSEVFRYDFTFINSWLVSVFRGIL